MPPRRNEMAHNTSRDTHPYGRRPGDDPMTPPYSRRGTWQQNENVNGTMHMPIRANTDLFTGPDPVVLGDELNRIILNPRSQLQQIPSNHSSNFTTNTRSRQSTDPTQFIASATPPIQGVTPTIQVDLAYLQTLWRTASENTGHTYGNLTIENDASVLQGNLYSGKALPKGTKKHIYGETTTRKDKGRPNLIQGDADADDLDRKGFWSASAGRTPQDRYHHGRQY